MQYNTNMCKIPKRVCVLVGAGMSAGAGIPTFRGKGGAWKTAADVRDAFEIDRFCRSKKSRELLWRWLAVSPAWDAKPTRAHWLLKRLDDEGGLISVMTQNFDMLEKKAGIHQGKIRQLHGRIDKSICLNCHRYYDTKDICDQLDNNPDPHCIEPGCNGILKPDIVFFGEPLDEVMLSRIAGVDLRDCDELWCVGSSLMVYPAAGIPIQAKALGKKVIIVSTDPTGQDNIADEIIREPADQALEKLVDRVLGQS